MRRSNQIWRRRLCQACAAVFTTTEKAELEAVWAVKSKSGTLTSFSRDKLLISLYNSCKHRKNALLDAASLVDTVIKRLGTDMKSGVVDSQVIRQITQVTLNRFDKAASVHYQAFHS